MRKGIKNSILNNILRIMTIEDFHVDIFTIKVQWHLPRFDENKTSEIGTSAYEAWLHDSGKLNFCIDDFDYSNEHIQTAGTMAVEQYWENIDLEQKIQDMKEYMIKNYSTLMTDPYQLTASI